MEIEKKFLVKGDFKPFVKKSLTVMQGYLSSVPERTVRVRAMGKKGFLTIKGLGNESGACRYEWEREIDLADARELLKLCESGIIKKTRNLVEVGNHLFEVDEFIGDNLGLIIAEIELSSEGEAFKKPDWLGREVTGEKKYYNSMLARKPFNEW